MNDKELVIFIKNNNQDAIKKLYLNNKLAFFKLANRYKINNHDALDIYQDSVVALIENAQKGNIDNLKSSVNTYLLGICKNKIYSYLKNNKTIFVEDFDLNLNDTYITTEVNLNDNEKRLKQAYETLGEQCQKILKLFYFENKKLDEIKTLLNYETKDVLKSQKSRCIAHLKKILK